jgi:RNA polymerase sigma-70 factor (ECF subfamily)
MLAQAQAVAEPTDRIAIFIEKQDHRAAVAECARRFGPALGRFCFSLLGSQPDAEEAVQETLLAAFKGMASWRGEGSLKSWLFGIARRQAARVGERRKRAQHLQLVPDDLAAADDASAELDAARRASRVRAALARLKPSERDALLLRYQAGLSYAEIASACSIEEATARKRASRGLARLRQTLSPEEIR